MSNNDTLYSIFSKFSCIPNLNLCFTKPIAYWTSESTSLDDIMLNTDVKFNDYNAKSKEWENKYKEAINRYISSGQKDRKLREKAAYFLAMKNHSDKMAKNALERMSNLQVLQNSKETAEDTLNLAVITKQTNNELKKTMRPLNNIDHVQKIFDDADEIQDKITEIHDISTGSFRLNQESIQDATNELDQYLEELQNNNNNDIILKNNNNNNISMDPYYTNSQQIITPSTLINTNNNNTTSNNGLVTSQYISPQALPSVSKLPPNLPSNNVQIKKQIKQSLKN